MIQMYAYRGLILVFLGTVFYSCVPTLTTKEVNKTVPVTYNGSQDSTNTATVSWNKYFTDTNLIALIDTALANNQELNITMQEIEVARNEVQARKGEYLPSIGLQAGTGVDKPARYTSKGANDATTEIKPGKEMPEPLGDFMVGAYARWELDVWRKLRNAKKAAVSRYLASMEGRNFMVTNLIAEIANSYYELLALDNQLEIVQRNIEIQENALRIVRLQKQAARVTELAVKRFESEVLHTRSLQYEIRQQIVETENRINYLVGRYPQPIARNSAAFPNLDPGLIATGTPVQLLENRPDVRQAELQLAASKLDVQVAKARFYPSIGITAGFGYQAYNPSYWFRTPESILYSIVGDMSAPLVNRNAIKAEYRSANAEQIQAVYQYEQTLLNAYIEVANLLSKVTNLQQGYDLKSEQVQRLTESITISNNLFRSARADYMEVLLTQRDALESRIELIEYKKNQLNASIDLYRALGGGWR